MKQHKKIVIALGGSIVVPDKIDTNFLKKFYLLIKSHINQGRKFIIVVGGGKICREYNKAADQITKPSDEDKDWLGIHCTHLNACLVKTLFRKEAHPDIVKAHFQVKKFGKYSVIISAGWEPGCSSDFDTCQLAVDFNIGHVLILGKPDYVYTDDFVRNPAAKPIEKMSWDEYFKLIPKNWTPGLSSPVDPVAARLAKKENLEVIVAGGKDLNNLKKILQGKKFKGTIISNKIQRSEQ